MVDAQRLLTYEEAEALMDAAESDGRRLELIDGELVEKSMPGEPHSIATGNLYRKLCDWVIPRRLGRVHIEVRHRSPADPYNARLPDLSFTRRENLLPVAERGAVMRIPDLCIEVQSPDDSAPKLRDKAKYYLANGAQLVWIVYRKEWVEVMYPAENPDAYKIDDVLTGGDVLPGFSIAVKDIFTNIFDDE